MNFLRYEPVGHKKPGLVDEQGQIRDLSSVLADINGSMLSLESLQRLRQVDMSSLPFSKSNPRIGSPLQSSGCLIGIGLNYRDHSQESGLTRPYLLPPSSFSSPPAPWSGPTMTWFSPNINPYRLGGGAWSSDWYQSQVCFH
jgi:2-keto-4-pentenoate hydratase/2-oxohepta-3-ene-1,7-dioic acid hydratase in catechol pathway